MSDLKAASRNRLLGLIRLRKSKSVLFLRPDYHCTFTYRSELLKRNWHVGIYSDMHPEDPLIFSTEGIEFMSLAPKWLPTWLLRPHRILRYTYFFLKSFRYEYHVLYGRPPFFSFKEDSNGFRRFAPGLTDRGFLISLALTKFLGIKMVFIPSGCRDVNLRKDFQLHDRGNVCGNCGFFDRCDESGNQRNISRILRYFSATIGDGTDQPHAIRLTNLPWKSIDLTEWHPRITTFRAPEIEQNQTVKILHSHSLKTRSENGKNIKGTPAIVTAVENLANAGYPVELVEVTGVPLNEMRLHQATADIVVDQLIYGWWGSTGVEAMALGKPLVCYLRPEWKDRFQMSFPQLPNIPVIEANVLTIESVLRNLIIDPDLRRRSGEASRKFAELHFDPKKNTQTLIDLLITL